MGRHMCLVDQKHAEGLGRLLRRACAYFQQFQRVQVFYKVLMGFRPEVPPDMPAGYRAIMEACWDVDPAARPSFDIVLRCLQARRRTFPQQLILFGESTEEVVPHLVSPLPWTAAGHPTQPP